MTSTTSAAAMASSTFSADYQTCTAVSELCPVQLTVLGYYPNLGANIFFAILFGICTIAALFLGIWKRTWTYVLAIGIGLIMETCGYIGRALMHGNPWANGPFELQICTIILAPTFICISIYLTLKHVSLTLNPALSRISPVWYPRLFLTADITCIVVQAIGGGIAAASGNSNPELAASGNRAIIAGVALQVVVLLSFGILAADYWVRVSAYMNGKTGQAADPEALRVWNDPKFVRFKFAIAAAYTAILCRCIYRIVEMAGGWGNHIMQDEPSFMVLDSSLMLIAVYLLTIFHPGLYFPPMSHGHKHRQPKAEEDSTKEQA